MARYSKTERIGINAVERLVLGELGWIFREQPIADMGIDAHIERVDNGKPTGKLIALQIKTGAGNFKETKDSFIYYGSTTHLDYWTGHSLPVLLIAHLPESGQTLWVHINEAGVTRTKKGWKVEVSKKNLFGKKAHDLLFNLFEGPPGLQRLRKLSIDEPLMRHIANGGKVSLELEDWINKSLGRSPVRVFIHDEGGNETLSQDWAVTYTGYGIKDLAETLFPWSSASVDTEFYEINADNDEDCSGSLSRAIDEDNGIYWEPQSDAIYPYSESSGEVEHYRLELKLNELGHSFLIVSDYCSEPD